MLTWQALKVKQGKVVRSDINMKKNQGKINVRQQGSEKIWEEINFGQLSHKNMVRTYIAKAWR